MLDTRQILAPTQAAAMLGISVDSLRNWAKRGRLPSLDTPRGRLYRIEDVETCRSLLLSGGRVAEQ